MVSFSKNNKTLIQSNQIKFSMHRSFREIVTILDKKGSLIHIKKEVNSKFEMSAIMKKLEQEDKAFIFENIKDSKYKAVGGIFTTMDRYGLIFNEDASEDFTYDQAGRKVQQGISNPIAHVQTDRGPVTENVLINEDINLSDQKIKISNRIKDLVNKLVLLKKKLENKSFLDNAPKPIVEKEEKYLKLN